MSLLETSNLQKSFAGFIAIDGVSFTIERGETRGLIGPNGAGKTTLFNLLSGTILPTDGEIVFQGENITNRPPHERTQLGISRSFQITSLFDELTVEQNLKLGVRSNYFGTNPSPAMLSEPEEVEADVDDVMTYFEIDHLADQLVEELSHGQKRKLEISLAIATEPELLLLDEPSAGLSPEATQRLVDLLERVVEDYTVVLVEHEVEMVLELADQITVLHQGSILSEGRPSAIENNEEVERVYMGGQL